MSALQETAAKIGQPVCERGKSKRNRTTKTSVVVFGQHYYFRNRFYTLKSHVLLRLENVKQASTMHCPLDQKTQTQYKCLPLANSKFWNVSSHGFFYANKDEVHLPLHEAKKNIEFIFLILQLQRITFTSNKIISRSSYSECNFLKLSQKILLL